MTGAKMHCDACGEPLPMQDVARIFLNGPAFPYVQICLECLQKASRRIQAEREEHQRGTKARP